MELSARGRSPKGAFLSSADYLRALRVGSIVRVEINRLFKGIDVLVTLTLVFLTPEAVRAPGVHRKGIGAAFTSPFNLTGHPALSIPCGVSALELPIGMQLVGQMFE